MRDCGTKFLFVYGTSLQAADSPRRVCATLLQAGKLAAASFGSPCASEYAPPDELRIVSDESGKTFDVVGLREKVEPFDGIEPVTSSDEIAEVTG